MAVVCSCGKNGKEYHHRHSERSQSAVHLTAMCQQDQTRSAAEPACHGILVLLPRNVKYKKLEYSFTLNVNILHYLTGRSIVCPLLNIKASAQYIYNNIIYLTYVICRYLYKFLSNNINIIFVTFLNEHKLENNCYFLFEIFFLVFEDLHYAK